MVRDGGVTRDEGRGIEKRISNNKQRMMNVEWQEFEDDRRRPSEERRWTRGEG